MSEENGSKTSPGVDIMDALSKLIGGSGAVEDFIGGYRIRVLSGSAFPWHEVFRTLVTHDFKVSVTDENDNLMVEAQP